MDEDNWRKYKNNINHSSPIPPMNPIDDFVSDFAPAFPEYADVLARHWVNQFDVVQQQTAAHMHRQLCHWTGVADAFDLTQDIFPEIPFRAVYGRSSLATQQALVRHFNVIKLFLQITHGLTDEDKHNDLEENTNTTSQDRDGEGNQDNGNDGNGNNDPMAQFTKMAASFVDSLPLTDEMFSAAVVDSSANGEADTFNPEDLLNEEQLEAIMGIIETFCPTLLTRAELAGEPMQTWIASVRAWIRDSAMGPTLMSELMSDLPQLKSVAHVKDLLKHPHKLEALAKPIVERISTKLTDSGIDLQAISQSMTHLAESFPYTDRIHKVVNGLMSRFGRGAGANGGGGGGIESVMAQHNAQQMKERMRRKAAKKAEEEEAERIRVAGLLPRAPLMSEQELLDLFSDSEPMTKSKKPQQPKQTKQQKRNR